MTRAALAFGILAPLIACDGASGTLTVALTTAPGSTVLDAATTLRVTLTDPKKVMTATRTATGFDLAFDVSASGDNGSLMIDALDATGTVIAVGASPPLPLSAVDSGVTIYMAAPLTIGASPVVLSPAVTGLAGGVLSYGVVLAGGLDITNEPSDALSIYNAYDHSIAAGLAIPAARDQLAVGIGTTGFVYLFGGTDISGAPAADLWQFDTTAAPSGSYALLGDPAAYARAGAAMLPLGDEEFLITGTPVVETSGSDGTLTTVSGVDSLPSTGVTVTPADGSDVTLIVGDGAGATGIERFTSDVFTSITADGALRTHHAVVAGPSANAIVIGGTITGAATPSPDALLIDGATSTVTPVTGALMTPRNDAAVAATSRYIVVAGGTDATGVVLANAEILQAASLAPVAVVPLVVPRTQALAFPLPNGQIMIVGGIDATGAPITTIELFTPDDPS